MPQPAARLAFTPETAIESIEELGYPAVLKPPVGSWGRLLAKVNDAEAAEAVLEHRATLGSYQHHIYYAQGYVEKVEGRDIRAFVIGDETVAAIYRTSPHWITNTARGGQTADLPITPEIDALCRAAAQAVGGGILAVDLLEDSDGTLLVNEVNSTPEFHGAMEAVDVDIAGKMVDYTLEIAHS